MRYVMTRVLPDPAPARMSSGPSRCSTASRCSGFSLERKSMWGRSSIIAVGVGSRSRGRDRGQVARCSVVASRAVGSTGRFNGGGRAGRAFDRHVHVSFAIARGVLSEAETAVARETIEGASPVPLRNRARCRHDSECFAVSVGHGLPRFGRNRRCASIHLATIPKCVRWRERSGQAVTVDRKVARAVVPYRQIAEALRRRVRSREPPGRSSPWAAKSQLDTACACRRLQSRDAVQFPARSDQRSRSRIASRSGDQVAASGRQRAASVPESADPDPRSLVTERPAPTAPTSPLTPTAIPTADSADPSGRPPSSPDPESPVP